MEANPLFGRPWKISGRFNSFEEADKKRKQLSSEKNLQVKVKKLAEFFVVKTRSTIVEKVKKEKVEKKPRRKQRKGKTNDR